MASKDKSKSKFGASVKEIASISEISSDKSESISKSSRRSKGWVISWDSKPIISHSKFTNKRKDELEVAQNISAEK